MPSTSMRRASASSARGRGAPAAPPQAAGPAGTGSADRRGGGGAARGGATRPPGGGPTRGGSGGERCAWFLGVGTAKATDGRVALLCTPGTAAGGCLPAVIEASHSRTPLLVLTADRPPGLRDVGANQAIGQARLYGAAVRW